MLSRRPSDDFIVKKIKHSLISQCKSAAAIQWQHWLCWCWCHVWQMAPIPKKAEFTNGGTNFAEVVVVGLSKLSDGWLVAGLCWLTEAISRQWDVFFFLLVLLNEIFAWPPISVAVSGDNLFRFCRFRSARYVSDRGNQKVNIPWKVVSRFRGRFCGECEVFFFLGKFEIYHGSVWVCRGVLKRGSRQCAWWSACNTRENYIRESWIKRNDGEERKKVDFFAIRPFPIGTFLWLEFYLSSYLCFSYSAFLQLRRRVCSVWVWVFALKVFLTSKNPPVRLPWPVGSPNFGKSGERRQIRECM